MHKVLVTGATGFIGYHVVQCLIKNGRELKLFVRDKARSEVLFKNTEVEIFEGNVLDLGSINRAMKGCSVVYHIAGIPSFNPRKENEIYDVNITGSENICKAALNNCIDKIVYTSSAATIGKNGTNISNESNEFNLWEISGPYKKSKVYAEQKILSYYNDYKLPIVVVNPTLPVGSHDFRPTPAGRMILNYLNSRKVLSINGGLNFIDVEDVASGHMLAEVNGRIGERYILGDVNLKIEDFYKLLNQITTQNKEVVKIPYLLGLVMGSIASCVARVKNIEPLFTKESVELAHLTMFYNVTKARNELKLPPGNISKACENAINWFKRCD